MPMVMSPISMESTPRLPVPAQPVVSLNSPSMRSPTSSPSPNAKTQTNGTGGGLLIPTDRSVEELEEKWLPKLGRLKVEREVLLKGYSLYALRTWYLSRTHWAQSVVTQTGKPAEKISAYLLVPDPDLSEQSGQMVLTAALQYLASETHAQPRKTQYGTLLVTTPSAFGQDIFPIPGGDLREMKPYLVINTDLRRLGCGGRAAMGMESPVAAVRRKFFELYRLPSPPNPPLSRTTSPTTSPSKPENTSPTSPQALNSDPFTHMLFELVRLIQASLQIWGIIGEEVEVDGLFCDETKKGVFAWRRMMGMEHEESMRMEKETSGGCIDPKTLAALLGSITSVRYQLDALDVEKVPKDPFSSPKRFLSAWHAYQIATGNAIGKSEFLSVSSIRQLNSHYLNERTKYPDALNIHRLFLSGVQQATSSLSANLKGGAQEDTPLRKREHHHRVRSRGDEVDSDSGVGLFISQNEVGPFAPPDVITTDLDAYTKGILKSREKDWDVMGARRIAALWSGQVDLRYKRSHKRLNGNVLRRKHPSTDNGNHGNHGNHGEEEEEKQKGAFGKMTTKTGQAIKGGLGFVSRKNTTYETSDSDTGGPGPSSLRNALMRAKQSTVPTVIEPDVEEVEEQLRSFSPTPSPGASRLHVDRVDRPFGTSASRNSFLSATSHGRPSIITDLENGNSDDQSHRSYRPASTYDEHDRENDSQRGQGRLGMADRAFAWRNKGRATTMLRTSSDGADVVLEDEGLEWEVINPHGTGKGHKDQPERPLARRHSLQDRIAYKSVRVSPASHLAVDVEMCGIILELRHRERQLAQRSRDLKLLEESIFKASSDIIEAARIRRTHLAGLEAEADEIQKDLHKVVDDIDDDAELQWANKKLQFYLSEDTHTNEIVWSLKALEREWENMREKLEDERKALVGRDGAVLNGNGSVASSEDGVGNMSVGVERKEGEKNGRRWWWFW